MIAVEVVDHGVSRALDALGRGLDNAQADAWETVGGEALQETLPIVPVYAGVLVDSLKSDPGVTGVEISSDVVYAAVQNWGWDARNITGHHFTDKTVEVLEDEAPAELENEIQALIRRVGLT